MDIIMLLVAVVEHIQVPLKVLLADKVVAVAVLLIQVQMDQVAQAVETLAEQVQEQLVVLVVQTQVLVVAVVLVMLARPVVLVVLVL